MDVLMVSRGVLPLSEDLTGGAEYYLLRTAKHLANLGHRVDIVAECSPEMERSLAEEGTGVLGIPDVPLFGARSVKRGFVGWMGAHFFGNVLAYRTAAAALSEGSYDVLHCHGALSHLLLSRRFPETPTIYTQHDAGPWLGAYKGRFERWVRRMAFANLDVRAAKGATRCTVVFQGLKDHLVERWDADPARIDVITPGAETDHFRPPLAADERRGFVFVGHLTLRKGVDWLLEMARRNPEFEFTIVGDGPQRKQLEATALRHGIENRVRFEGVVANERLRDYLTASRGLVLPARSEGLPLTVLESQSCATPVVAFDVGGLSDAVRSQWNGFLAPLGDLAGLESGMRRLADEGSGTLEDLGANGRRLMERRFSWRRIAENLEEAYGQAASATSRKPAAASALSAVE